MKKRLPVVLITLILAFFIGVSIGVAALRHVRSTSSAPSASSVSSPSVSVLRGPSHLLPTIFGRRIFAQQLVATQARRVAQAGPGEIYVAPGVDGTLCLLVRDGTGAMSGCADPSVLNTGAIYLSLPQPDGSLRVIGLVRDGVTSASDGVESANVSTNVFVLQHASRSIKLKSAAGTQTLDLGPQEPSVVQGP
jgi:hypothetical protein